MYHQTSYLSPVGELTLAGDGEKLVGLWRTQQKYYGANILAKASVQADAPPFIQTRQWLDAYFQGKKPPVSALPLAPEGSEFRRRVWKILCEIPYGELTTYGAIAAQLAREMGRSAMSAQAVGGAVGHNPISIIIPCHRVVGAGGSLTGYAGGLEMKQFLLAHEGVELSTLTVPTKGTAL